MTRTTTGLLALPTFADMTAEDLQDFRRVAFDRQVRTGTVMARIGQATQGGWLVVGGTVHLVAEIDDLGKVIADIGPGGWVNPASAVDGGPAGWTAVAGSEVQAWLLTPDSYRRLMDTPSAMALRMGRIVSRAVVEDTHLAGRIAAELQRAVLPEPGFPTPRGPVARSLSADDLRRLGFARLTLGNPAP